MKIAFFSTQPYDRQYFDKYNQNHQLVYFDVSLQSDTVELASGSDAICVFVNDQVKDTVVHKMEQLGIKLLLLRCAGFNNVDIAAAKAAGIKVARVPEYSPYAVAEHTVALILTLNRKTHKAYNRVRDGNFSLVNLLGFDLHGKTVGVVGMGKIGQCFAKNMLGFGCKVLAFDLISNPELENADLKFVTLEELFSSSDIISLHCPLNEKTRHLINKDSIKKMKTGVMIVNTGRGALIDTSAVIEGLKSGHIGNLALDVYEQEDKLFFRDLSADIITDDQIMRLMSFPNVLITAHQAFFTDEALTKIAQVTFQNIADYAAGRLGPTLVQ
jgi:D-lactate dehydrogenase